jgi:hypothetical protein
MKRILQLCFGLLALVFAVNALADEKPRASFAIVVGSNVSVDANVAPLHYADDDAARYFDFFRLLGTKVTLLARIDDATRALHPQAAAEAMAPRHAELKKAAATVAAEVSEARKRGFETTLYFVFAGHGGVDQTRGYLALEDARLSGEDLGKEIVELIDAQAIHMILDACNSYLVAYSRGPGGERRPAHDYTKDVYELAKDPRVGLLLSTSSATESHEWDAFQAGVFSHEVRSGLYGAADADGDGQISYREIGAFVARANEAIENQRFRPKAFAQAPKSGGALVDIKRASHLKVGGEHAGRYLLEDARGVRLADFNSAPGQPVTLVRPAPRGVSYLRHLPDDDELVVPSGEGDIAFDELEPTTSKVASRGALHASFSNLFAYPFNEATVAGYREPPPPTSDAQTDTAPSRPARLPVKSIVGIGLTAAGAVGLGLGTYFTLNANSDPSKGASQEEVAAQNDHNHSQKNLAIGSFIVGGVVAASGLAVLLWPTHSVRLGASGTPGGAFANLSGRF